jgi:hypothetical protein
MPEFWNGRFRCIIPMRQSLFRWSEAFKRNEAYEAFSAVLE